MFLVLIWRFEYTLFFFVHSNFLFISRYQLTEFSRVIVLFLNSTLDFFPFLILFPLLCFLPFFFLISIGMIAFGFNVICSMNKLLLILSMDNEKYINIFNRLSVYLLCSSLKSVRHLKQKWRQKHIWMTTERMKTAIIWFFSPNSAFFCFILPSISLPLSSFECVRCGSYFFFFLLWSSLWFSVI